MVAVNRHQSAIMAPTEILATQHFETITGLLKSSSIDLKAVLLTGSMTAANKREVYEKIASGEADIIIGTHAVIQDSVEYDDLGLAVIDEQHRFGAKQRETLMNKSDAPHLIVMSATPIPRSLGIVLFGDLDISIIDEMPKNRLGESLSSTLYPQ